MAYGSEIKQIMERLATITFVEGRKDVTRIEFTYDAEGDITAIQFYSDADLLFTLTFNYDVDKNLISIERS